MMEKGWAGCGFASIFCTVWGSCLAMLFDWPFSLRHLKLPTLLFICLLSEVELRPPNLPHWNELLFFWNQFHLRQFLFKDMFEVERIKSQKQSRSLEWQIGGNRCTSWQLLHQNKNRGLTVMKGRNRYLTGSQRRSKYFSYRCKLKRLVSTQKMRCVK